MENVRMAILDNNGGLITFLDNRIPNGNKYYDDELTEYLKGGKASKLVLYAIKNDTLSEALIVGNKLSFVHNEQDYYFNIMYTESNETYIKIEAYSLNFELLNEEKTEYEATGSKTFEEYVDVFDFENVITIGLNEVSNLSMQLTFSGSESMLARLFSLADYFSAELEFLPVLNDDYSLSKLTLNVYKEHDDDYQGVGEDRTGKTLHLGTEIYTVEKSVDLTDLYTAIYIENNDGLNLNGYEANEYDDDGVLEYYTSSAEPFIRAPQARDLFPSNLLGSSDRYIAQYVDFDCDTQDELYAEGLRLLKLNSTPKATYEIKGDIDAGVGDTILVDDPDFKPRLILEARVSEKVTSFTNPQNNQLTFTNVEEFDSEISSTLTAMVTAAQVKAEAAATAAAEAQSTADTAQGTFEDYTPTATLTEAINTSIIDDGKSIATGTVTLASDGLVVTGGSLIAKKADGDTIFNATGITNAGIQDDLIQNRMIVNEAITAVKLAVDSVTHDKIMDDAVTELKIAADAVTEAKIATGAITEGKVGTSAITELKIAAEAITEDKIITNAVTADKIKANAITADKINTNAVTSDKIMANAITSNKIISNAITAVKIDTDAVTADKIIVNAVTSDKINASAVTADKIAANAVTVDKLKAGTISTNKMTIASDDGGLTLSDNLITLKDSIGTERISLGKDSFDKYSFTLKDSSGNVALSQSDSGNLVVVGDYTQKGTYGDAVTIKDNAMVFYDYTDPENEATPHVIANLQFIPAASEYSDESFYIFSKAKSTVLESFASDGEGGVYLWSGSNYNGINIQTTSTEETVEIKASNTDSLKNAYIKLVYDKSNDISSVETQQGCDYSSLTAGTNWDVSGSTLSKNKFGNFVCLNLVAWHSGVTSANDTIGTLPTGYAPLNTIKEITFEASGGQKVELNINTDGTVKSYTALTNTSINYIYANIVYPTEVVTGIDDL